MKSGASSAPSKNPGRLIVKLLYGSGLRLLEALTLRVQDVGFARGQVTARFAERFSAGSVAVVLDPDVASVFQSPEAVNAFSQVCNRSDAWR